MDPRPSGVCRRILIPAGIAAPAPPDMRTFIIILLTHLALGLNALALTFGDFTYTTDGVSVTITDYPNSATGAVVIPETIDGKPVTAIGYQAFRECEFITEVSMPDSIVSMGAYAFFRCYALASISISQSIDSIPTAAFGYCSALTSITIPDSAASIDNLAFNECSSLATVTIGNTVTSIGASAFRDCSALTSITIPDSVTSIGDTAFAYCYALTSASIGHSVTSIGTDAFNATTELQEIQVVSTNSHYSSIDGILYDKAQATVIQCPRAFSGDHIMPATVTTIGSNAFSYCRGLTSIVIPDGVTSIPFEGFRSCHSMVSVTLPANLASIGNYAFHECRALTSITLPASTSFIGNFAFQGCTSLTTATIPTSLGNFGGRVFSGCTSLTEITLPDSKTSVGFKDFSFCTELTSITVPANTTTIYEYAFSYCPKLATININPANTNFTTQDGAVYTADMTELIRCPPAHSGPFTLPASVNSINDDAFIDCPGISSITVGAGNTSFTTANGLLITADEFFLKLCPPGLTGNIDFPTNVNTIELGALELCTGATSFTVDAANTQFSSANGLLFDKDQTTLIRCPAGMSGSVEVPASVIAIEAGAFANCTNITAITVAPGNTSYAAVDGALYNSDLTTLIVCPAGFSGTLTLPDTVTTIDTDACRGCTSLTAVELPPALQTISSNAFLGCSGLTSIIIPDSVTQISWWAFFNCDNLTTITFLGNAPSLLGRGSLHSTSGGDPTAQHFADTSGFTTLNWFGYPVENMGSATPVKEWLINEGFGYDQDTEADLNGDGVALLTAYALNLDPTQQLTGQLPQASRNGNALELPFYGTAPGVAYTVTTSEDLVTWQDTGVTVSGPDGSGIRTATLPIGTGRCFMRLEIAE